MQTSSHGDCLIYFRLLLPLVISFSIIAPVRAVCLVYTIVIPQMSVHSLVSLTVPRSPVNKFLLIDQVLVTCPLTDDTYPRGPFVFDHLPSVPFMRKKLTSSLSLTSFSYHPSCPFLPGHPLARFHFSRFHPSLYFLFLLYT